jgi:hypothetical protein
LGKLGNCQLPPTALPEAFASHFPAGCPSGLAHGCCVCGAARNIPRTTRLFLDLSITSPETGTACTCVLFTLGVLPGL